MSEAETCPHCGGSSLWGNYFNRKGEGSDGTHPGDRWRILCEVCGKFTDQKARKQ
jgi:hypothetical protein